ncbi:MAG: hypothetical protein LC730_00050 [Acidobacteria bacterium]|nr:hypothetical protein [Acidobacteriota bacterium]
MDEFTQPPEEYAPSSNIFSGANWFYWVAILSAINTLIIFFFNIPNLFFALGTTQWLDGTTGTMNREGWYPPLQITGLLLDLLIAAVFAGFGYLAKKGSDVAFVIGIFFYIVDGLLAIGLRDFFGSFFHLIPLFFMFKGLLASRHLRENATSY